MNIEQEKRKFCQNILHLRKTHGLTQEQMAGITGIGISSLRRIEQGVLPKRIGANHLFRIAEYFHIRADSLFDPME